MVTSRRRSIPVFVGGVLLVIGALLADPLGLGGAEGIGLRELFVITLGATLIASQVWVASGPVRCAECMGVWAWFGLLCGLAEAGSIVVHELCSETVRTHPDQFVWMLPVTYITLFVAASLLVCALRGVAPSRVTLPTVVFVPAMIVAWSITRELRGVHELAGLALAAGVGAVAARLARVGPQRLLRIFKVTGLAMALVPVVGAVAVEVSIRTARSRALAELAPPPAAGAPNVLLIVLDTVRADHLGAYGYGRPTTPHIDALADAGVMFEQAIAPSPWTLPTHATMFTGRYQHDLSVGWLQRLDDTYPTLAEVLGEHGYVTAGFVGNLGYCTAAHGLNRGFVYYEDYDLEPAVFWASSRIGSELIIKTTGMPTLSLLRNRADTVTDRFLAWVEHRGDRPFFAFLNYFDAHAFYVAPDGYDTRFGPRSDNLYRLTQEDWWQGDMQEFIDAYDGCIRFIDDQIGRLCDGLRERGLWDDTVIIVTSDHGEMFGEHQLQGHANSLYRPLLHVPLIVHQPNVIPAGTRIEVPVSLRDFGATVLDLVGAEPREAWPGYSLVPLWRGDRGGDVAPTSPLLAELAQGVARPVREPHSQGPMQSIHFGGLHYIRNGDGTEELYDAVNDTREAHNLIDIRRADAQRARAALARALGSG